MKRRQLLVGLAGLFVAPAQAQIPARTGKPARVGIYLTSPPKSLQRHYVDLFEEGMRELGWGEGSNIVYERAYATSDLQSPADDDKMLAIAKVLVERKPEVIWLASSTSAKAVLDVTRTIPVVGAAVSEVIERGFAKSLSRPGGNFTGISNFAWELGAKRFQLLHEFMPKIERIAVLMDPSNRNCLLERQEIEKAAAVARTRVALTIANVILPKELPEDRTLREKIVSQKIAAAFTDLAKDRAQAVLITHLPVFQNYRRHILKLAAEQRIPAVGHRTFFAEDGALFSYSTILDEQMRGSARLVDKILKGANPGDIPIEQPKKFELVINGKTAKILGLTIPPSLLIQGDDKPRILD